MRFGLKSLFLTLFAAAVFLFVGRTARYWVTAGTAVGLWAVRWAVRYKRRGIFIPLRVAMGVAGVSAVWFLTVDWSWFVESCPDCHLMRDIEE